MHDVSLSQLHVFSKQQVVSNCSDVTELMQIIVCDRNFTLLHTLEYNGNITNLTSKCVFSQVWQLDSGQCQKTLVGHEDAVTTLTYDNTTIISGSLDCTIRLWCLSSGQCMGVLDWMSSEGHTGIECSLCSLRYLCIS